MRSGLGLGGLVVEVPSGWSAVAAERALGLLRERVGSSWRPWFCGRAGCDGLPHGGWGWSHARADQCPPPDSLGWFVWLLRGGRGSGKTRAGSEWVRWMSGRVSRLALVARTVSDLRDTVVEGDSGVLATSPAGGRPVWEPSKRRLSWPNGCVGFAYSAEEPDRLRGPQHGAAWCDEPAHWPNVQGVWDNLVLGLRLGEAPRICATTTPRASAWLKGLLADPLTVDSRVSTYTNLVNLAPTFRASVLASFEGTRLGRQELHGELLEDVPGALWFGWMVDDSRVPVAPADLRRVVVGVDPAGTAGERSDEAGVVTGALGPDGHVYVLGDDSGRMSPREWAEAAVGAFRRHKADCLVIESNYGGQMVTDAIGHVDPTIPVRRVHTRRGKVVRAEPVVARYEQGHVHHVGVLDSLEREMLNWVPDVSPSPNRVDALVHMVAALSPTFDQSAGMFVPETSTLAGTTHPRGGMPRGGPMGPARATIWS